MCLWASWALPKLWEAGAAFQFTVCVCVFSVSRYPWPPLKIAIIVHPEEIAKWSSMGWISWHHIRAREVDHVHCNIQRRQHIHTPLYPSPRWFGVPGRHLAPLEPARAVTLGLIARASRRMAYTKIGGGGREGRDLYIVCT